MTVGKRIRAVRKHFDMTSTAFANLFNMSQSNLSGIENDNQKASVAMLEAMYKRWNISPKWLLAGQGTMFETNVDGGINFELIVSVVEKFEALLLEKRVQLAPKAKGIAIAKIYEHCYIADMKMVDDGIIERIIKLVI